MKGFLIVCLLLSSMVLVHAQNKTINNFYKTHRKGEDAVGIRIPGWVVQAGINIGASDKESREELKLFRPFLRRLIGIRLLSVDSGTKVSKEVVRTFIREVKGHNFNTLARIKDEGTNVDVLVRIKKRGPKKKRRSIVKNILLVVQEEGELAVFTVNGRWDMSQVKKILKEQQVRELWAVN